MGIQSENVQTSVLASRKQTLGNVIDALWIVRAARGYYKSTFVQMNDVTYSAPRLFTLT